MWRDGKEPKTGGKGMEKEALQIPRDSSAVLSNTIPDGSHIYLEGANGSLC